MSVQNDPLVGRRFGNYVVERLLGAGGMGAVYCAVHPEIGKKVAIKFLAPDLAQDATSVQRFFAEARAVNLIQHENIVDIFDFRVQDGQSYFVMELLNGRPLGHVLQQEGKLPLVRTLEIGVQIAAAISAAHTHGVLHRDLKPDNVFLTPKAGYDDFVKVLDFGIAKLARPIGSSDGPLTLRGMVMGTPGYMSPEQGTGDAVDARTDVYALGVLLFRALAGRLPFEASTMAEMLQAQLARKPPLLAALRKELPAPLCELVQSMIHKDPGKRPELMREVQERMVAQLVLLANQSSPSGRLAPISDGWRSVPPTRHQPPKPPSAAAEKKRQVLLLVTACLVSAGAVTGAVLLRQHSDARHASAAHASPLAPPARATPAAAIVAPTATRVASTAFRVRVDTRPGNAEIWAGTHLIGTSPVELSLDSAQTLRLHLSGYRDEPIAVGPATPVVLVPLLKLGSSHARTRPEPIPGKPPHSNEPRIPAPVEPGTGLGLND